MQKAYMYFLIRFCVVSSQVILNERYQHSDEPFKSIYLRIECYKNIRKSFKQLYADIR